MPNSLSTNRKPNRKIQHAEGSVYEVSNFRENDSRKMYKAEVKKKNDSFK